MVRILFSLILLASPLLAQDKAELCSVSAEIAGLAVEQRVSQTGQAGAISSITQALDGSKAGYAAAVEPIVGWVYTLPEDQLTEEVATAYQAACLAQ